MDCLHNRRFEPTTINQLQERAESERKNRGDGEGEPPNTSTSYTSTTEEPVDDTRTLTTRLKEEAYGQALLYAVRRY
jgi:hypothetical protein